MILNMKKMILTVSKSPQIHVRKGESFGNAHILARQKVGHFIMMTRM